MEAPLSYLLQFGNLNQQQTEFIYSMAEELKIRKDEYFSGAGKIPRHLQQVGFVVEGIIRICYHNNEGEDITKYFIDKNHLIANYQYFEANTEASEYLQAVTDCKLIVFSKQNCENISNTVVGWDSIQNKMIQKFLLQKLERRSILLEQDGTTRYLTFLEKFPTLVNLVPLAYIASYLGITPSSLSRIRKNIR